jgi:hypothetical protein
MSMTERLMNGALGVFQGAALFTGFALGVSLLMSDEPNLVFVLVLAFLGALVGAVVGLVVLKFGSTNALIMMGGSILTGLFFGLLILAFDYLFFDSSLHIEWVLVVMLLFTAPGILVGWFIATQLGGEARQSVATNYSDSSTAREPVVRRPRLPTAPDAPFYDGLGGDVLGDRLQQEVQQLSQEYGAVEVERVAGTAGAQCVTLSLAARDRSYHLFIICSSNYPYDAPQLMVEKVNPRRPDQGTELHYSSQTIAQWNTRATLMDIVREAAGDLLGSSAARW